MKIAIGNFVIETDEVADRFLDKFIEALGNHMTDARLEEIKAGIESINASEEDQSAKVEELKALVDDVGAKVDIILALGTDTNALRQRINELENSLREQTTMLESLQGEIGSVPGFQPILEKQQRQTTLLGDLRTAAGAIQSKLDSATNPPQP